MDEFLAAYADERVNNALLTLFWDGTSTLSLFMESDYTAVRVRNPARSTIESIFTFFEEAPPEDRIALQPSTPKSEIVVFIGHGRSRQWDKLKSHLQYKHGFRIEAYETGARAGHTIRDILDSMTEKASLALLVLTGEDKTETAVRARQNVIHECGLFQGRLGFDRAILLVEDGVEMASNFDGIQQLRFKKGRISEVFGDVITTIRREFGPI